MSVSYETKKACYRFLHQRNSCNNVRTKSMKPLAGIRILDLTKVLPGPLCTQCLGADAPRRWPPFRHETGAIFLSVNRNKRSLAVDLKSPEGQAIVHKLAA